MSTQAEKTSPAELTIDEYIGRRVHTLMWDQQVTQVAFADAIGMDQSSVAKRLRGKLGWHATHLMQAAQALNTTISYLVGETENPHPNNSPDGGVVEPPARLELATYALQGDRNAEIIPLFAA